MDFANQVSRHRLADDLWQLVNVPSPTLRERDAALCYAEMLRGCGAAVEIDETLPESPNVVGRLRGARPGPVLQLAGHLDHIDVPHPPPRREADIISGRGAADMKNGLAGMLEITRLLHQWSDFPGDLLITAFGRHEAPLGDSRGLHNLIARGVKGDAAIVFEGPEAAAVVMALGMSIWKVTMRRRGQACHEMTGPEKGWGLIGALDGLLSLVAEKNRRFGELHNDYPLLPPESVFIGQIHYGDFYNRVPASCAIEGTRRWHPDKTVPRIEAEFAAWLEELQLTPDLNIETHWIRVGESFAIDPAESIVRALQKAWREAGGREIGFSGHSSVNDTCRLVTQGKIPAVLCGFDTETGHADYEFVRLDRMETACRVALSAALNYLNAHCAEDLK
ncbi:MAG: M20 family metallopeptidase [Pirellulales bacterium]|nr:M20 family metallopeptidase [Pirellulales bacterium]